MQRIRKGDQVVVIAGRDRGTKGTVLARVDDRHVLVEGVNVVKKAVRPNPTLGIEGGIVDKTLPIDQSNVMLVNPETGKGERIGFKEVDGKKVRVPRPNEGPHVAFQLPLSRHHCPRTHEEVRLQDCHAGSAHHQDHAQHGRW